MGFGREQKSVGTPRYAGGVSQPKRRESYGEAAGWYTPSVDWGKIDREWRDDSTLRAGFGGNYESFKDYQREMFGRSAVGLEDDEVYGKAMELDRLRTRGRTGAMSEWEKTLRDSYSDASNKLYTRAQMSGRNRAAVSRAYESGTAQQGLEFDRQIQEMRTEESKIAGDALKNLLFQARSAGGEAAAAEAQMLQQWQINQDQASMDLLATTISGLSTLAMSALI